jgi:hypothetical protein
VVLALAQQALCVEDLFGELGVIIVDGHDAAGTRAICG